MAVERDADELAALMPRTKAATDRAQVDARSLQQYMEAASKQDASNANIRLSVMVRSDVRKDNQGFEDIDEFWADDDDDDDLDDDDDDDDDDDASTSERDVSANVSIGSSSSTSSERHVRLSTASANDFAYNDDNDDDVNLSTDTMDLDDDDASANARRPSASAFAPTTSKAKAKTKAKDKAKTKTKTKTAASASMSVAASSKSSTDASALAPLLTTPLHAPQSTNPRFSRVSTASSPAPSHDFDMSTSFDTGSAMKPVPIPTTRNESGVLASVKKLIARKSLQTMSPIRNVTQPSTETTTAAAAAAATTAKKSSSSNARSRDSFANDAPGFDDVSSPFSIGGDPMSPLSNTSERDLDVIRHSAKETAAAGASSPTIRKTLFKATKTRTDSNNDSDTVTTAGTSKKRKSKAAASSKSKSIAAKSTNKTAPKSKQPAKRGRPPKTTAAFDDAQTDNDSTLNARTSDEDNDNEGDSDADGDRPTAKSSRTHARDLFDNASDNDDDGDNDDAAGTRRSKRRRFKPLAWYKGEHYIYERRSSGVGLVIPTVAGIERVGTTTPTKTARTYSKRYGGRPSAKAIKPLPKTQLPRGLKFDDGEWADLYDAAAGCVNKMNVICRATEIEHRELPSVDGERSGFAGQSFNLRSSYPFSRWICGRLGLPAGAAKEAESVGDAVQVFYVTTCQPQAVEVAFGPVTDEYFDTAQATRFLLNPGDEFYVPSRNAYYLKNYSTTTACDLHFTIMKPDLPATVVTSGSGGSKDRLSPSPSNAATASNVSERRTKKKKRLKP